MGMSFHFAGSCHRLILAIKGAYNFVTLISSLSRSGFSMNLTVPSFPLSPAFCRMPVGVPMPGLGVAGLVGDCFRRPFGAGMPFMTLPFVGAVFAAATA